MPPSNVTEIGPELAPGGTRVKIKKSDAGLNGASMGVLSAISKYGLLEDAGYKELRVSDLTDSILFPDNLEEKTAALQKAANSPVLFAEINEKWPDRPPGDGLARGRAGGD